MQPFLGQITIMANTYAPVGYAYCDGQLVSIASNAALYSLIGTTWGGNGQTNFALPDMRGRIPIGQGYGPNVSPRTLGQMMGTETVTLTTNEMPAHNHSVAVSTRAANGTSDPENAVFAVTSGNPNEAYQTDTQLGSTSMGASMIENTGGNGAHENMMRSLALQFVIALQGTFPQRP